MRAWRAMIGRMHAAPLPESKLALKALAASLSEQIAQRDRELARREALLIEQRSQILERDAQLAEQARALARQNARLGEYQILIDKLKFELANLRRIRFGKTSEAIGSEQLALWAAELDADIDALQARLDRLQLAARAQPAALPDKRQPKRQPLPEALPRREERLEPESTRCSCGAEMIRIGEDIAETLEIIPSVFYVRRRIRGKWACRCCEKLAMAPVAAAPIDKAMAGASLLAQVMVAKYMDHLPLHRQEGIYARMGVAIPRSTMAGWIGQLEVLLEPLVELLRVRVISQSALQADETPVRVLDPGSGKTATGYLWAYRTLPSSQLQAVVFDFAMSRSGAHPTRMLANFIGTLQVDGYSGYREVLARPGVIEAGCFAHARRKFVEVFEATRSPIAQQAILQIAELYKLEREFHSLSIIERQQQRQERAVPLLETLHAWLLAMHAQASPRSALAQAMLYSLNRWKALTRYVEDGRLPPDTNAVENAIRGIAVGKKNWLFAGSAAGGQRAALIYSLIETAKMNAVAPLAYLRDILERLPTARARDLEALLPWNWQPPASVDGDEPLDTS
jgi:transposase